MTIASGVPLKYLSTVVAGQSPASEDVAPLANGQPFLQGNAEFGQQSPLARYECSVAPKVALPGDVLMSVRAPVGALNVADRLYGIGRGLCAIRPREIPVRYLWWWLHHARDELNAVATGSTFEAVSAGQVGSLRLPSLTPVKQRGIADFLDRETAEIDAMIAKQEELVGLLGERRSAVIAHAVTKGLNPNAPLKDSGVEWLGDVPAHWEVKPLKYAGRSTIGLTYSPADLVDDPAEGTLVLRAGNIQDGRLSLEDNVYVAGAIPDELIAMPGDILICARNGSARLIGKNCLIPESLGRATWGAFMTVLRSEHNDYLRWLLSSAIFTAQIGLFKTSTINQLTNATLNSFMVPLPPEHEQLQIARQVEDRVRHIDAMTDKARESIELMRERRAALISDAVTGRLDLDTYGRVEREGVA